MMCRNLWTLWALSVAAGCLIGLAVANEALRRLDAQQAARRRTEEDDTRETAWLVADSAQGYLVFERDGGAYVAERN